MSTADLPGDLASRTKPTPNELADRKVIVRETLCCPHCQQKLSKWEVPDSPFTEWPSDFQYICFNDSCSYFLGGWKTLAEQGAAGTYRFMYDPATGGCHAVTVLSTSALRECIVGVD